jgi:hypothetical protein
MVVLMLARDGLGGQEFDGDYSHASSDWSTMGAHAFRGEPMERHHAQRSSIERNGIPVRAAG